MKRLYTILAATAVSLALVRGAAMAQQQQQQTTTTTTPVVDRAPICGALVGGA